ncbi:unnamed protein product [Citrullus colocynthis]|uniref:Uncharacterized protein n=1 Tax=Citrullus colocynthis TaxID=252529 RepID=A0ABP0Y2N4_9ROSI
MVLVNKTLCFSPPIESECGRSYSPAYTLFQQMHRITTLCPDEVIRSLHVVPTTKLPSIVSKMKQQKTNGQQSLSCSTVPPESSFRLAKWILYNGILVHPFTRTPRGTRFGNSF